MYRWVVSVLLALQWSTTQAQPHPVQPLTLDFTFPTAAVIDDVGRLRAIAIDPGRETVALLNDTQELFLLTLEGELIDRLALPTETDLTGMEWLPDDALLLSARSGSVYRFDLANADLTLIGRLPRRLRTQAVAYSSQEDAIYAVGRKGRRGPQLVRMLADGSQTFFRPEPRLRRYHFTGLHAIADALYASVLKRGDRGRGQALVVKLSTRGRVQRIWQIGGRPSGLAIVAETERGPIALTSNADADATVQLYEPPPLPGDLDVEPLPYLGQFSFGNGVGPQPSGVSYSHCDNKLYFITDFGRVLRSEVDGTAQEILFDVAAAMQGTFESIAVDDAGLIYLLASDESTETRLLQFDSTGKLLSEQSLIADPMFDEQSVRAFSIQQTTQDRWWISTTDDNVATLTRQSADDALESMALPQEYADFSFSGLEVVGNTVLLLTDERDGDDTTLSGLLIAWDWLTGVERARFGVGAPDASGTIRGVIAPSGVAFSAASDAVFVTSDTDTGTVYAFDLDDTAALD